MGSLFNDELSNNGAENKVLIKVLFPNPDSPIH
jgi:hypothetical protein